MSFNVRSAYLSAAVLAGVALAPMAVAAVPSPAAGAPRGTFGRVCTAADLGPALLTEVNGLPTTASAEDYEAAIVYRLSQDHCVATEVSLALDSVSGMPGANAALQKAVSNIRLALLSRRLRRGTAAIDGGGGVGFSAPIVSIGGGGGSSNYPR